MQLFSVLLYSLIYAVHNIGQLCRLAMMNVAMFRVDFWSWGCKWFLEELALDRGAAKGGGESMVYLLLWCPWGLLGFIWQLRRWHCFILGRSSISFCDIRMVLFCAAGGTPPDGTQQAGLPVVWHGYHISIVTKVVVTLYMLSTHVPCKMSSM
jgi:hypothetical protein